MGSKSNVVQCHGNSSIAYGVEVWGDTISLNAWNEIEKIQKMFLRRQLGVKCTTSNHLCWHAR